MATKGQGSPPSVFQHTSYILGKVLQSPADTSDGLVEHFLDAHLFSPSIALLPQIAPSYE